MAAPITSAPAMRPPRAVVSTSGGPGPVSPPLPSVIECHVGPRRHVAANAAGPSCSFPRAGWPEGPSELEGGGVRLVARAAALTLVAAAVAAATAPAARAEAREWQPRRTERRMGQARPRVEIRVQEAQAKVEQQVTNAVADTVSAAAAATKVVGSSLRKAVQGDGTVTVSVSNVPPPSVVTMPSSRRPGAPSSYGYRAAPRQEGAALGGTGGWLLAVAAAAAAWYFYGSRIMAMFGGGRSAGGRWIRDRSLGGKMVFIPDEPAAPSTTGRRSPGLNPLEDVDPDASSRISAEASSSAPASLTSAPAVPDWWATPRKPGYVSEARAAENGKAARQVLRFLEDAKLQVAADAPMEGLVQLYQLCRDAGVTVNPRTDNGRESLFRAGLAGAATAAQKGRLSALAGETPAMFIGGLASFLGMTEPRAVQIARAEVAARSRSVLTSTLALMRAGDSDAAMLELLSMHGLFSCFAPHAGAAETELVAAAMSGKASETERLAMLDMYRDVAGDKHAPLMAEHLNLNPEVVL